MHPSPVLEAIYRRRSIREFSGSEVLPEQLHEIIRAGSWAPSGLNNQPWRFVTIRNREIRDQLAEQTRYGKIVRAASALIAVFLDQDSTYNKVKDYQAVGACLQNMLLAVEALELGAVWLGEILNNKAEVNRILGVAENCELMAVLAIGYPAHRRQKSKRKRPEELILKDFD